ncbi:MAG: flavodoxin-dependent (E)-4-hydroxy-3-methylbut-2-enyl-diphosphate synthase, partial [Treponema sp.]|nr:flavodoxin-dependent (E)-4-hydroxy-3-methylbut-2-enyl-diphosphate synthase [Treponema sp.]
MHKEFFTPREVTVGGFGNVDKIIVGGANPVTIQTMWKEGIIGVKDNPEKLEEIRNKIASLKMLGCDIIRFAVPDMESAESFIEICKSTSMPLVADIHFDYRLALKCLEGPVAAIRINPGNIGARDRVEAVVNGCREKGVAIRIGVNSGSLPHDLREMVESGKMSRAVALSETAARESAVFDELNFDQFVVSMKASSVAETIEANEDFASKYDIPLH